MDPSALQGMGQGGGMDPEQARQMEERRAAMEERRQAILKAVLSNDARERLGRIATVKQEKARQIEDMIIQAAQSGRLQGQVTDDKLVEMLEGMNEAASKKTTVRFSRKTAMDDDW